VNISVKRSLIFMIAGLTVFVVYLYLYIGPSQILYVLRNVNPTQYAIFYSLAILAVLGSVFCWSAAWNSILKKLCVDISYRKTYLFYWVGNFTDLIIPCATVCGELTRLYLVQRETKENYGALGASAITNRLVAYAIVTSGLYIGSIFVLFKHGVPALITNVFILLILGSTGYLAVLLFLAFSKSAAGYLTKTYFKILKVFRPKKLTEYYIKKTQHSMEGFYEGFKVFRENPRYLIRPIIFHALAYILGLSVFVLVFYALGITTVTPGFYIAVYFIATSFQDASASFSVGSLDILLATIFILYGISSGLSGIAVVILRSALFWFPLLAGFVCVQIIGAKNLVAVKPKDMRKSMEERKLGEKTVPLSESPTTNNIDLKTGKIFKIDSENQVESQEHQEKQKSLEK
jgi:uncharacterized protein (TIRG00374 family)